MSYELLRPDIWECIRRGGGYCPCAIIKDEESRCICKEFREGQETNCHCGVWRKHDETRTTGIHQAVACSLGES